MASIRLVALDLDGTLLNSNKDISPGNLAALARLRERGVLMVPVTGRPSRGLPKALLALPGLRYLVTSNGATIRDMLRDEILLERHLTPRQCRTVLAHCSGFDGLIREAFRGGVGYLSQADYDLLCTRYQGSPLLPYMLDSRRVLPGTVEEFLQTDKSPVEELFLLTKSPEEKQRLHETLSVLPDISFADPFPNDLEVLAGGLDKGVALTFLLNHLGIAPEETLAMGDGGSDRSLLQAAGIGIAMANAVPSVKEAAHWVTSSCDDDGVARALEKFVF